MRFQGHTDEFIELRTLESSDCHIFNNPESGSLTVLWFLEDNNRFIVDGKSYCFMKNQVVFFTEFHQITVLEKHQTHFLRFNRSFYCIIDHDDEISCKGLLFFGASQLPIISIPIQEEDHFATLWKMFTIEMELVDNLQIGMLQMMLKRYLILCTRLYKAQNLDNPPEKDNNLVREFNFLVEQHFKTKHSVAEYAELLNKSPKTISNIFAKIHSKSPLQYIKERRLLEARRLLIYSDKQVQEVAYEIGFEDIQAFSRFFKKQEGISPSEYKKTHLSG